MRPWLCMSQRSVAVNQLQFLDDPHNDRETNDDGFIVDDPYDVISLRLMLNVGLSACSFTQVMPICTMRCRLAPCILIMHLSPAVSLKKSAGKGNYSNAAFSQLCVCVCVCAYMRVCVCVCVCFCVRETIQTWLHQHGALFHIFSADIVFVLVCDLCKPYFTTCHLQSKFAAAEPQSRTVNLFFFKFPLFPTIDH